MATEQSAVNNPQTDIWSLGCDIVIEDNGVVIQEASIDDITLSGVISVGEMSVDVNFDKVNVMDLDINVAFNGITSAINESQVVPYNRIVEIGEYSPEATSEKRFAASAYSARKLKSLIESLEDRVGSIEESEGEGGGLTEDVVKEIQKLKDLLDSWFEYDATTNMLKANYGIYSFGPLVAGGKANGLQISAVNKLSQLKDVQLSDLKDGESLVFDDEAQKWINALIEGGEGGSATLENDITADVAVGNIKKGTTLPKGTNITEILTMMFSQAIINVKPTVTITDTPEDCEVGTTVIVKPNCIYKDGKYKTSSGEIAAGCVGESTKYYLENNEIETPYTLETSDAKQYKVGVGVRYAASTANVTTASGSEYTDKIQAGTATDEKTFNVCYKWFFGSLPKADVQNPTSDKIRTLLSDFILPTRDSMDIISSEVKTDEGKWDVVVVPKGYRLSAVIDSTFLSTYHEQYKSKDVTINCAGDHKKDYRLYYYESTSEMGISKVTIVKE